MTTIYLDVEADALLLDCTKIWCFSICDIKDFGNSLEDIQTYTSHSMNGTRSIEEGLDRLRNADKIVGHNVIGYDAPVINKFYGAVIKFNVLYDTFILSLLINPKRNGGHSLKAWGEYLGCQKLDYDDFSQLSQGMVTYNRQDVLVGIKLYNHLKRSSEISEQAFLLESKVAEVLLRQYVHGFRLDKKAASELSFILHEEQIKLQRELHEVFSPWYIPHKSSWNMRKGMWDDGEITRAKVNNSKRGITKDVPYTKVKVQEFNPGSEQQIYYRLSQKYKWIPKVFTEKSKQPVINSDILETLDFPEASLLQRFLRIQKQLGQLESGDNAWLKLEKNGRVHGQVWSIGTRTHRMSHKKPNMANVDKKDLRMRRVWLPDEGEVLVGFDADSLELRILGHYLAPYDDGEYARIVVKGKKEDCTDIHSCTQRLVGLRSRDSAKKLIYAFLYGAQAEKIGRIISEDENVHGLTEKEFVEKGSSVREMLFEGFKGLETLSKRVLHDHNSLGYVIGLDGRRVYSCSPHSALNTLIQSGGAIVMKAVLVEFDKFLMENGIQNVVGFCSSVHDEYQISVDKSMADRIGQEFIKAIQNAGKTLKLRCELTGSYKIGSNWAETH